MCDASSRVSGAVRVLGLDPSGTLRSEAHLPLAATAHYTNAAPIMGTSELANVDVSFEFHTERVGPNTLA